MGYLGGSEYTVQVTAWVSNMHVLSGEEKDLAEAEEHHLYHRHTNTVKLPGDINQNVWVALICCVLLESNFWTTTLTDVLVKELHECESSAGVGVSVGEAEEGLSWAWAPSLCRKSAGSSPSESAQGQSSLLMNTQKQEDNHPNFILGTVSESQHI